MEDSELVEADFQQYYNLDLRKLFYISKNSDGTSSWKGFYRYHRLFSNLPTESRIMKKIFPAASWRWEDEVQSRILHEIQRLNAAFYNANRDPKKSKPIELGEQFQPDYIKELKGKYEKKTQDLDESDLDDIKSFWKERNSEATYN